MTAKATTRLPWEDRWTQPTLDQLLEPIEENRRKIIDALIERISEYEGVGSNIAWHGISWRWTLELPLTLGGQTRPFVYIVPKPEAPIVCVPMPQSVADRLPLKRLNRFIREGIRSAKCAVDTQWAKWTPSAGTEVEHLMDLVKRLHKMHAADAKEAA
jgi:hypothetical protein